MPNKTQPTSKDPDKFVQSIEDEQKRKDCEYILNLMKKITKKEPVLWGDSLIGFDKYTYKYATGRTGEWFKIGFSPRKNNLTIYLMCGFEEYDKYDITKKHLGNLGKYKLGKSCLYLKNLEVIDKKVLENLIKDAYASIDDTLILQ